MSDQIITVSPTDSVVAVLLGRLKKTTARAYRDSLHAFAKFLVHGQRVQVSLDRDKVCQEVASFFYSLDSHHAHAVVGLYTSHMAKVGLSSNTISARLTALQKMHQFAKIMVPGVTWDLYVEKPAAESYTDTRGCGFDGFVAVMKAIKTDRPIDVRDRAILCLLYDRGFRRGEVASLDRASYDRATGAVTILRKRRTKPDVYELPRLSRGKLDRWLDVRGDYEGSLFTNLDPGHPRGRLSPTSLYRMVRSRGNAAGIKGLRPHKLRHAAITRALELTNGNTAAVSELSGHLSQEVLKIYNDNRRQHGKDVADALSSEVLAALEM